MSIRRFFGNASAKVEAVEVRSLNQSTYPTIQTAVVEEDITTEEDGEENKGSLSIESIITDVTEYELQKVLEVEGAEVDGIEFLLVSPYCLFWGNLSDCPPSFQTYFNKRSFNIFSDLKSIFKSNPFYPTLEAGWKFIQEVYQQRKLLLSLYLMPIMPICPVNKLSQEEIDEIIKYIEVYNQHP